MLAFIIVNFSGMEGRQPLTVLICPLNWGLGHATRCVPVINALLMRNCRVVVAADGPALDFLQYEYGQLDFIRFRGKTIRYNQRGSLALKLVLQAPALLWSVVHEHFVLKRLVKQTGASLVISDNRYGLWSNRAKTVFITHQIFIQAPPVIKWIEPLLWLITRFFVKKFTRCWVPDLPEAPGLSGLLSHAMPIPGIRFVGPLSRFTALSEADFINPMPNDFSGNFYLCIISGPEPQRSKFEELLKNQFEKALLPTVFVLGKPGSKLRQRAGTLFFIDHPSTTELAWLIKNARLIICRPGYSTVMDLTVFGKKALLVPSPGQTEQLYLGQVLLNTGLAHSVSQKELNLDRDIGIAENCLGLPNINPDNSLLNAALDELLGPL